MCVGGGTPAFERGFGVCARGPGTQCKKERKRAPLRALAMAMASSTPGGGVSSSSPRLRSLS